MDRAAHTIAVGSLGRMHREHGGLDIGVYGARGVPSTYSGYETFLTLLLPELARRGDRVTMYCRSGEEFTSTDWQGVRLDCAKELWKCAVLQHTRAEIRQVLQVMAAAAPEPML